MEQALPSLIVITAAISAVIGLGIVGLALKNKRFFWWGTGLAFLSAASLSAGGAYIHQTFIAGHETEAERDRLDKAGTISALEAREKAKDAEIKGLRQDLNRARRDKVKDENATTRRLNEIDGLIAEIWRELANVGVPLGDRMPPSDSIHTARFATIVKQLSQIRQSTTALKALKPDLDIGTYKRTVQALLSRGIETSHYRMALEGDGELVAEPGGTYYRITPLRAAAQPRSAARCGRRFCFEKQRYVLGAAEPDFRTALQSIAGDIVLTLRTLKLEVRVFVLGGADKGQLYSDVEVGRTYTELEVWPKIKSGFHGKPDVRPIPIPIRNDDLPVLRAAYAQALFAELGTPIEARILDSQPVDTTSEVMRTVDIILHVRW